MEELFGKVKIKKSSLPFKIVTNKTEILGKKNKGNEFNNHFTDLVRVMMILVIIMLVNVFERYYPAKTYI